VSGGPVTARAPVTVERLRKSWRRSSATGLNHRLLSMPAVTYVLIACCLPLGILVVYSFWPTRNAEIAVGEWTLGNYTTFFTDSIYWQTLLRSFLFAAVAAALSVAITFPLSYFVALRVRPQRRLAWIMIAILPFTASYVIRVYAWLNLFGDHGILNDSLLRWHLIRAPLGIFGYGRPAIVMTFVYLLFPLSFLTTYVAIERIDPALLESASDLGARPWRALTGVVLPIARTGLLAGFAFCFISILGDYVTPTLVGGSQGTLYSNFVVTKFDFSGQWGFGSALAFILLASMLGLLLVARRAIGAAQSIGQFSRRYMRQRSPFLLMYSALFVVVLYAPIALLVLFAFNSSDLIGFPIAGLTLRWFLAAFDDPPLLEALQTSLTVVAYAVSLSLVFGTLAAVQLARTPGRWRSFSIGVLALPFSLPPLMMGLGILTGLHVIGVTRGLWTIITGHALLILPVVAFIVMVRLEGLDPNIELAALDLGARPWQALLRVTIPQAFPAILASALIGLAMSMDEFILTFLVTGRDVTLPLFIYGSLRYGVTPELNALSSMMLASSFVLCGVAALTLRGWGTLTRRRRGAAAAP
jgi:ABC-type spermidine/putrescine transport system permease subunit II